MEKTAWWKKSMQVIQYNLQVKDTPLMDPVEIAKETEALSSNVVVMNVGGIYAWYPSKIPFHHVNEYLPKGRDLLRELIDEFHKRGIRFVARFDFSITDDTTYLQKPQWFARKVDKEPYFRGEKRMGDWSLFLNTCALGGYRNEDVGVPVMKEVLKEYDIDGIFLNAPHASVCFCERCQKKYRELYGKQMPETSGELEPGWLSECMKENIGNLYDAIKSVRSDVPLILYYAPFTTESKSFGKNYRDSIYDRYMTADLICTESQNILSHGIHHLPETIHPVMSMKAGQLPGREKLPFGIIHSCPGMDWRHVGMPVSEYLPWMAQVPASGGVLWHSVTGFPATITDKRVLEAVGKVNAWAKKAGAEMEQAQYRSDILVLWNGLPAAKSWADILVKNHLQFDLMNDYAIDPSVFSDYGMILIPDEMILEKEVWDALRVYMEQGGSVLLESADTEMTAELHELLGISEEVSKGEYLLASYLRFERKGKLLQAGMETDKIPFRGSVNYCIPEENTLVLATLVPPFAPYEVVGAPPERASIPVAQTEIPLTLENMHGKGGIWFLPFSLNTLVKEYHMEDHYRFAGNLIDELLGEKKTLVVEAPWDVQVTAYEKEGAVLLHLVNEIGQRPLLETIPVYQIHLKVKLKEGQKVRDVQSVIAEENVTYSVQGDMAEIVLDRLSVWDMIAIHITE